MIATTRADYQDSLWERFWKDLTEEELAEVAAFFADAPEPCDCYLCREA